MTLTQINSNKTIYSINSFILFVFLLLATFENNIHPQNLKLVWSDEFDGETLDDGKWEYDIGLSNDNVHYYTDRTENINIVDGILNITALKESYQGFSYTSGLIKTAGFSYWKYGRIEASIKLPKSNGFVPAFWMLPEENLYGWWPKSGEIDIMEHPTNEVDKIYGTVHTQAYNSFTGSGPEGSSIVIPDAENAFHVYAIEWNEDQIDFYVDDQKYFTFVNDGSNSATWPFNQKFYLILNLAVGGGWVGDPDENTIFPATMEVDYVRVFQDISDIDITGPDYLSVNSSDVEYSLPFIENATYTWTLPAGVELITGENSNTIKTNWSNFGGTIKADLQYESVVYTSELSVNVSKNYLLNPEFDKGVKYWNNSVGYPAAADFTLDELDSYSGAKSLKIDVQNLAANPWDIQLSQRGIQLDAGKDFIISFWAKEENGTGEINAALINPDNFNVYKIESFSLSSEWTEYEFTFNTTDNLNAALNIDLGIKTGIYHVDDFSITAVDTDINNILSNSDFSSSDDNWYMTVLWPAVATGLVENGEYKISIDNGGNNTWDIFMGQSGLLIENGKDYLVSFDAYAESPRTISAFVGKNADPWTVYSGNNIFNIDNTKKTFTYSFKMNNDTDTDARLGFDIGTSAENITFDNIYLIENTDTVTSVQKNENIPENLFLSQNYPNPFNPVTTIKYSFLTGDNSESPAPTLAGAIVKLVVYNLLGEEVAVLVNEKQKPGIYELNWDPSADGVNYPSGIYLYKLSVGNFSKSRKMILLK